jgi:hypothetical protein
MLNENEGGALDPGRILRLQNVTTAAAIDKNGRES